MFVTCIELWVNVAFFIVEYNHNKELPFHFLEGFFYI